jgi:hypothetical protein
MPDVTEKVERTDTGFRLTVESTRGTGTRDQDKVKAELRTEDRPDDRTRREILTKVKRSMRTLRAHQPDEDGDSDDE